MRARSFSIARHCPSLQLFFVSLFAVTEQSTGTAANNVHVTSNTTKSSTTNIFKSKAISTQVKTLQVDRVSFHLFLMHQYFHAPAGRIDELCFK